MYQYQPPPQQIYYGSRYGGCLKLFLYALSFFIPLLGIILGIVYMSRPDPESKRLGQACLIIGIISFIITCCAGVIFGLAPTVLLPFLEEFGYYY